MDLERAGIAKTKSWTSTGRKMSGKWRQDTARGEEVRWGKGSWSTEPQLVVLRIGSCSYQGTLCSQKEEALFGRVGLNRAESKVH
jgi:hypothetical protein